MGVQSQLQQAKLTMREFARMVRNEESHLTDSSAARHFVLVSCSRAIVRVDVSFAETQIVRTRFGKEHLRVEERKVVSIDWIGLDAFRQL